MLVYATHTPHSIILMARAEGEGVVGDLCEEVLPTDPFATPWNYQQLRDAGEGLLHLPEPWETPQLPSSVTAEQADRIRALYDEKNQLTTQRESA